MLRLAPLEVKIRHQGANTVRLEAIDGFVYPLNVLFIVFRIRPAAVERDVMFSLQRKGRVTLNWSLRARNGLVEYCGCFPWNSASWFGEQCAHVGIVREPNRVYAVPVIIRERASLESIFCLESGRDGNLLNQSSGGLVSLQRLQNLLGLLNTSLETDEECGYDRCRAPRRVDYKARELSISVKVVGDLE